MFISISLVTQSSFKELRDDYVYIVDHDNISAYHPADRFILLRVPAGKLLERSAYEFFAGTPTYPAWKPDLSRCIGNLHRAGQVFSLGDVLQ